MNESAPSSSAGGPGSADSTVPRRNSKRPKCIFSVPNLCVLNFIRIYASNVLKAVGNPIFSLFLRKLSEKNQLVFGPCKPVNHIVFLFILFKEEIMPRPGVLSGSPKYVEGHSLNSKSVVAIVAQLLTSTLG